MDRINNNFKDSFKDLIRDVRNDVNGNIDKRESGIKDKDLFISKGVTYDLSNVGKVSINPFTLNRPGHIFTA
ncbi:MAG: hypothetical protein LW817_01925 [Candidatus Caenarcaniphilales bacterium]|jgi:hypothetical protein|nr:hypothetical protein [Candidatus Caenarcaniphilales bacterium]